MSKTYEFLKQCGTFFVTTVNGSGPAVRPFGAVMEYNNEIYISTAADKDIYSQIKANPSIQIAALKAGTRDWIRVSGKALETSDLNIKQMFLDACPVLISRFGSKECEIFVLLKIAEMQSELYTDSGILKLS